MSEETKNPGMEPETKETEPEQELEQNGTPEESGVAVQPEPEQPSLEQQLAEQNDKYMRLAAEYDNFRKRTARERESLTALYLILQVLM